jgi:hypothetical protein
VSPLFSDPDTWRSLIDVSLTGFALWVIRQLTTRAWITRGTYDEERADDRDRMAYVEARRQEEREGRIKAEERVQQLTQRWDRALELLTAIERETIRLAERRTATLRDESDR